MTVDATSSRDDWTLTTTISGSPSFTARPCTDSGVLKAHSQCNLEITYRPPTRAVAGTLPDSAVIQIHATRSEGIDTLLTALVFGTAIQAEPSRLPSAFSISPSPYDFGSVAVREMRFYFFNITNTSSYTDTIATVSVATTRFPNTWMLQYPPTGGCSTPAVLAAQQSCKLTVSYTPQAAGKDSTQLLVRNNRGNQFAAVLTGVSVAPSFGTTPASLNFSRTAIGDSTGLYVQILNSGNSNLDVTRIVASPEFSVLGECVNSIRPNTACTILVWFKPTGKGRRLGTLSFTDNAEGSPHRMALTGLGGPPVPEVRLQPSSIDFGAVQLGATSSPQSIVFSNVGDAPLLHWRPGLLSDQATPGNFIVTWQDGNCPTTLAINASCTATALFQPTHIGSQSGTFSIFDLTDGEVEYKVALAGHTPKTAIAVITPDSIGFAPTAVNATQSALVHISNGGDTTLTVHPSANLAPPFFLPLVGLTCNYHYGADGIFYEIAPNTGCGVPVFFEPTVVGSFASSLTFTFDAAGSPKVVKLTGKTAEPKAVFDSTSLNFGRVTVGDTSASKVLALTNTGDATLHISTVDASAPFSLRATNCGKTLEPLAKCTFTLYAAPTNTVPSTGTFTVASDAASSPTKVPLSLDAHHPGWLAYSDSAPAFGNVPIGTTATKTVTISNAGGSAVEVGVLGPTQLPELNGTNSCPPSLDPNKSCSVSLTFSPTGTTGSRSWPYVVRRRTNLAEGYKNDTLRVTGTATAATTKLSVTPSSVTFASVPVGVTINGNSNVTLRNSSTSAITIKSMTTGSTIFAVSNACSNSLAAGASCTVIPLFTPAAVGPVTGSISIVHTGSSTGADTTSVVALSGTATSAVTVQLSTSSLQFPSTAVGSQSAVQTITITSLGDQPLRINDVRVIGGDFTQTSDCVNAILPRPNVCTINVTFAPRTAADLTGGIEITDNANIGQQSVRLSGTGTSGGGGGGGGGGTPTFSVSPSDHDFGTITGGSPAVSKTFTVTNTGGGSLTFSNFEWSTTMGTGNTTSTEGFTVSNGCQGASLSANQSCTFTVTISGATARNEAGPHNDWFEITHNASGSPSSVGAQYSRP
ncbi:MAG: choice-of-anchor D domain-containing protein [Gemmatimonadetes bacterium]|nr:choice-of-anchor D domain-containing protein [Gemmatimonadota bacterium]